MFEHVQVNDRVEQFAAVASAEESVNGFRSRVPRERRGESFVHAARRFESDEPIERRFEQELGDAPHTRADFRHAAGEIGTELRDDPSMVVPREGHRFEVLPDVLRRCVRVGCSHRMRACAGGAQ